MNSYAIFLRGVNVGGINIKMADLKQTLETLPVTDVKTLLASGNVVCRSAKTPAELKLAVETTLREAFGYDAWVVILPETKLQEILTACPYPDDDKDTHSYLTLTSSPAALDELQAQAQEFPTLEFTRLSPESIAWLAPAGGTLDSPFSKLTAKAKYKATTTTRNLRTLIKCRDALNDLA